MTCSFVAEVPEWLYVYWNAPRETDHKLKVCVTKLSNSLDLTRFNKYVVQSNKLQMANGQGSHWRTENPAIFSICIVCSYEISVSSVLNIFTLLAFTQSVDNSFHSFIILCEKEYFLMSNLCDESLYNSFVF